VLIFGSGTDPVSLLILLFIILGEAVQEKPKAPLFQLRFG